MAYDVLCRIADGLDVPRGYLGLTYDGETAAFLSAADRPDADQTDADLDEVGALLAHAAEVAVGMEAGPAGRAGPPPARPARPCPAAGRARTSTRSRPSRRRCARWTTGTAAAPAARRSSHRPAGCTSCSTPTPPRRCAAGWCSPSADLDNLAGWTSFDVGLFGAARGYFARALTQARRAGDASLMPTSSTAPAGCICTRASPGGAAVLPARQDRGRGVPLLRDARHALGERGLGPRRPR